MRYKKRYSIGDMSRICNISTKALRYYDKIGLIPSQRKELNNYRYYTQESLLAVPVIKYYKQMGFKLEEIRQFVEGTSHLYTAIQRSFKQKSEELEHQQEEIRRKYVSVRDWHALIAEAQMVIDNKISEVSVKYVEAHEVIFQDQFYDGELDGYIINIDFTNFLESVNNEITGPVILRFSSREDRVAGKHQAVRIMQKPLLACPDNARATFGGQMMITCYHIGPHEQLVDTYKKMQRWAREHAYTLGEETYERYVADYWTTRNNTQFVTEVMMRVWRGRAPELRASTSSD